MIFGETKEQTLFVDVILPFPLQQAYTYSVPDEFKSQVEIGRRAVVQFGKKKIYTSIIVAVHTNKPKAYKSKEILDIMDPHPIIFKQQLDFWQWIADYYCCTIGEVMSVALPSSMKLESESTISINPDFDGDITYLSQKEQIITEALIYQKELTITQIQDLLKIKNVFNLLKNLYLLNVILPKEELKESYKPKLEKYIKLHPEINSVKKIKETYESLEKAPKQLELFMSYQILERQQKTVTQKELLSKADATTQAINALIEKRIFVRENKRIDRIEEESIEQTTFELNEFQKTAYLEIKTLFKEKNTILLHGITSSGKTHIYIKLIEETIQKGKQVLYLVPEIALTTQLIQKLKSYFGEKIGIYHSKFNQNERYEIWHKSLHHEYNVVLGVRSALFLPFADLGLIVIDEEHENTFKQQHPAPRYQARDSAIFLANQIGAKCLLGSATPSFETFANAKNNKFGYVKLTKRYQEVLPPIFIINDLRIDYKKKKMKSHFGDEMFESVKNTVEKKDQVILFQNRRGYAPYLECSTCGNIPKCKNCDISLTYHKLTRKLSCHYCGYKQNVPNNCPNCGTSSLIMKGFGTEKIEDDLELLFPGIPQIRMDLDTTRSKHAYKKLITKFEKKEALILTGTQMVTKGLDFENVKLVGILNADQMISYPDFRAAERSFQLMFQVGGRAGRRKEQGKVIIQTFNPTHPVFNHILEHDFEGFYEREMLNRQEFYYPPYSKLILLTIKNKDLDCVSEASVQLAKRLKLQLGKRVLGPEFPPVNKLKNEYIMQIMLKFERNYTFAQQSKKLLLEEITKLNFEPKFKSVKVMVDVDPY